ncbi:MAG: alpha/beta fold hydrolase [Bacteroidales bacterium]|jgi:pimeloyl-ACP methyl ester carboxylesterase|nr:alpha/beta fold hydrolase [Bacteroidales bacterium]
MSQSIEFKNQNIHFCVQGEGPDLVLLHGFTESLQIWNDFAEKLSQSFRVICIDLPGHGRSGNLSEIHSMELIAEVVHAVLSFCRVQSCVLVGHSMGGYVTLAFANLFPEMLKGIVLFHSQADADSDVAKQNRDRTVQLVKMNRSGFINQFIPGLFAEENHERLSGEIEKLKNQAGSISARSLVAALEGMKLRTGKRDVLAKLSMPVLFIVGKKDSRIPFDKVMEQIAIPKHAEALLLNDVGHMGYLEAPETIFNVLNDFVIRVFKS